MFVLSRPFITPRCVKAINIIIIVGFYHHRSRFKGNSSMAIGKVKWFNNAKGFGFIVPENGGEDIFAHYSTIKMEGYRSLKAGQAVTYDVTQGPKGLHAENIAFDQDAER
jgi:CspA family cold shock protein